jgi:hypothetical protein
VKQGYVTPLTETGPSKLANTLEHPTARGARHSSRLHCQRASRVRDAVHVSLLTLFCALCKGIGHLVCVCVCVLWVGWKRGEVGIGFAALPRCLTKAGRAHVAPLCAVLSCCGSRTTLPPTWMVVCRWRIVMSPPPPHPGWPMCSPK